LVSHFEKIYPGSLHVKDIGMDTATDSEIWNYAKSHQLIIVSKDTDFHQKSFLYGQPPKVIWIEEGNSTTSEISDLLIRSSKEIEFFFENPESAFLVL
jgi:predicted nuclease of predicted toxin-antitoxin system